MPAPATSSRHLYTGHHQGGGQGCPLIEGAQLGAPLSRGSRTTPVSVPSLFVSMRQQWYRTCSSSRRTPDPLVAGLLPQRSPRGLLAGRSLRWFELSACTASPEGQPPSLAQHASWCDLAPLRFRDTLRGQTAKRSHTNIEGLIFPNW